MKKFTAGLTVLLALTLLFNTGIGEAAAEITDNRVTLTVPKELLYIGETVGTKLMMETTDGLAPQTEYISDKPEVAVVDTKGNVTALNPGNAIISARIGSEQYSCRVTVLPRPISMKLIPREQNIYKNISDKLVFRTGINTDLIYIAASSGGGFKRPPSYLSANDKYGLNQRIRSYFKAYTNAQSAKEIYNSAMSMENPPKKFVGAILHDLLKYDENLLLNKSYPSSITLDALQQFAEVSKAEAFFKDNRESYQKMVDDFATMVDFDYLQRLEAFYGEMPRNARFEVVLSTVMDGGQATYQNLEDGSIVYYNIMNPGQSSSNILMTLYHETAHNFYDVRQRRSDLVNAYSKYSSALGSYEQNFGDQMNETITRAVTAVVLEQYHSELNAESDLMRFEQQGFKNVHGIYKLIKNKYMEDRGQYKTFDSFMPVIFDYIKTCS